jgi:glycosyltransferase involved in cell wall biosynthesis
MMKLSVVVPAYNEEKYIESCLRALRNQSIDFELVVVDNASSDATGEIAERYADIVIREERKGVAFARERGWREASGDVVAFTDADTIVPSTWAETITKALQSKAIAAYGPVYLSDGLRHEKLLAKYGFTSFLLFNHFLGMPHFSGQNFAVKRDALEKVGGFNLRLKSAEDVDLSRRLSKLGEIKFIRDMVVYTSSRRLRKGYLKFFWHHSVNYLSMLLTGTTNRDFEDVR